jgi:hypothetical protein
MPSDDCFGLDHDEGFSPFLPDCRKASPEKAVFFSQSGLRAFSIQNGKLLPQGEISRANSARFLSEHLINETSRKSASIID